MLLDHAAHIAISSLATHQPAYWYRSYCSRTGSDINLLSNIRLTCVGYSPIVFVRFVVELLYVYFHPAKISSAGPRYRKTTKRKHENQFDFPTIEQNWFGLWCFCTLRRFHSSNRSAIEGISHKSLDNELIANC